MKYAQSESESTGIPLGYAAPLRWYQRRRVNRIVRLFVLLTLAFYAWRWTPWAWRKAHVLYWQEQCLNFSLPPDQVVYEEDGAKAGKLLASGSGYLPVPITNYWLRLDGDSRSVTAA